MIQRKMERRIEERQQKMKEVEKKINCHSLAGQKAHDSQGVRNRKSEIILTEILT